MICACDIGIWSRMAWPNKTAVNVFLEFEHTAMIGANALKNSVAVKQAVIEDGNFRVVFVVIFAINKNFHFRINAGYGKNG